MPNELSLTEPELAKNVWGVTTETVAAARRRKAITPDGKRKSCWYYYATVDAFHASVATNMHVPIPSVAAILSGEDPLLTLEQVTERLHLSISTVRYRVQTGSLGAIHISPKQVVRVPASEVAHYEAVVSRDDIVGATTVATALCLHREGVRRIITDHLTLVDMPGYTELFVEKAGLKELIERLLHGPVTFAEWWEWIVVQERPVTSVHAASAEHSISQHELHSRILAGQLVALQAVSESYWRIPVHCLEEMLAKRRPRTRAEIAALFGVSEATAFLWTMTRALCRSTTHKPCPDYWCIAGYVQANMVGPHATADEWIAARAGAAPLVPADELYDMTEKLTPRIIDTGIEQKVLDGIWLPEPSGDGVFLHITPESALEFVKWRDRYFGVRRSLVRY